MNTRQQLLQEHLKQFDGRLINEQALSDSHQFSLKMFVNPKELANPRFEITTQYDITDIQKNYELHYKNITTPPATFTTFFKWMLLKAMYATPFNWRYINRQWYQLNNLPLFIVVRTNDKREQVTSFIYDVTNSSWINFVGKHVAASQNPTPRKGDDSALYHISNQIERLHIPRMTHYRTTVKIFENDLHRPSIVFSDPYPAENRLYLPIYFSISHASLTPKLVEDFLYKLNILASKMPDEVQREYKSFSLPEENLVLNRAKL
jgi:chloramphenicol O-acetyltransferase